MRSAHHGVVKRFIAPPLRWECGAREKVTIPAVATNRLCDALMSMETVQPDTAALAPALSDADVVDRVVGGDRAFFEILMRRHNQQIYRAVRAILKDEQEVEDAMQQAYVNAFTHLHQFERRAKFSTWLT